MKQFILRESPDEKGEARLTGEDFHYLVHVRRMKVGYCFQALLPSGQPVLAMVTVVANNSLSVNCQSMSFVQQAIAIPPIILFQALPKGQKMDLIARQAAEGGLSEIHPFLCERCQAPKRAAVDLERRLERWSRIIREARQQSGSPIETAISEPCDLKALLAYWAGLRKRYARPVGILLHQIPLEQGSFHEYLGNSPDVVVLAIGPEGGFSDEEAEAFKAAGFRSLVIGGSILRTETAALYAAAAVRIILLERKTWVTAR